MDQITFRTTDMTRWGVGQNSNLSKTQIDINFWVLLARVVALEDHQIAAAVGIHDFFIDPSDDTQFFVLLTDGTQTGPFALPQTTWKWTNPPTGEWLPLFAYKVYDLFIDGLTIYQVIFEHTSAATFDPNANDGHGHNFYQVMLEIPRFTLAEATDVSMTSPLASPQVLRWSDLLNAWTNATLSLDDLSDVFVHAPTAGETLIYDSTLGEFVNGPMLLSLLGDVEETITPTDGDLLVYDGSLGKWLPTQPAAQRWSLEVSASDETTALTTGTAKLTFYADDDVTLDEVFTGLSTASASGVVTTNVKRNGSTIFSTKPTIGATQDTSLSGSGSVAAILSVNVLSKGDKVTIDIDAAGTTAKGLKVVFRGTRP